MILTDKLDELIDSIDDVLAVLDDMGMKKRSEIEALYVLDSAFSHLDFALDNLCEFRAMYEKGKNEVSV